MFFIRLFLANTWKKIRGSPFTFKRKGEFISVSSLVWGKSLTFCTCTRSFARAFSSPEAALLLVSTKNRDLWPSPTTEVRDSRTSRHSAHAQSQVWQIWLVLVSINCVYKSIQNRNVVGPDQRSRFLVLTKRSAASGDENGERSCRCDSAHAQGWLQKNKLAFDSAIILFAKYSDYVLLFSQLDAVYNHY